MEVGCAMLTDGQTMKPIVAFRDIANAPKMAADLI
jgi:hypothetical protein